jgi:MFS superfamily sulfate permease-like transporter
MSRTMVQVGVGGKTLVTSAISMGLLVIVILVAGPLFEALPKAILASIIIVALKSMLLQVYDLPKFYKRDLVDGALWVFVFLATILLDIDYGLYVGIAANLLLLVYRGYDASLTEVGAIGQSELFAEISDCEFVVRPSEAVVWRIGGELSFANNEDILHKLKKMIVRLPSKEEHKVGLVLIEPKSLQNTLKMVLYFKFQSKLSSSTLPALPTWTRPRAKTSRSGWERSRRTSTPWCS